MTYHDSEGGNNITSALNVSGLRFKHIVYYFKYRTIREHSGHTSLCPVRRAFASVHFISTYGHQTMEPTKS